MSTANAFATDDVRSLALSIHRRPDVVPTPHATRWHYLQQYGRHAIAFATMQSGLEYLDVPEMGFVAYKNVGTIRPSSFVLGDPVCAHDNLSAILDRVEGQLSDPIFMQVSKSTAAELVRRGFYANQIGIETTLSLATWDLRGSKKQNLRTPLNRLQRQGVLIREVERANLDRATVQAISQEWLQSKPGQREICFFCAPLATMNHEGVRTFVAERDGDVLGVAYFTPLFEAGRVTGYYSDIVRTATAAPPKLAYVIKTVAALAFKAEGCQTLALGLSPAFRIEDKEDTNSPFTTVLGAVLFQYFNKLYGFKGMAKSKRYFDGHETHVYLCTRRRYPIWQLYRLLKACGIHPGRQLLSGLMQPVKGAPPRRASQAA